MKVYESTNLKQKRFTLYGKKKKDFPPLPGDYGAQQDSKVKGKDRETPWKDMGVNTKM